MKSYESQSTLNESMLWNESSLFNSNSCQKPLCPGKNQATHLCLNTKCYAFTKENKNLSKTVKNSFICSHDKCQVCCTPDGNQCEQSKKQTKTGRAHSKCILISYKRILFCIQQKKKDCSPLKEQINKIFDDFIDYLSQLKQKYLDELKYHGLSPNQQKFLCCFDKRQFEQITPELSLQIVYNLPNQLKDDVLQAKNQLEKYWKQEEIKAKKIFELIEKNISKNKVQMDSKIVVSEKEQLDLIKMLQDQQEKTVKQLYLLYRASQNNFDVMKFHQKCDLIQHTVVVIQTKHGKKIGGYTPLAWDKQKHNQYSHDSSGESFIFSLTNNHKFTLLKSQEQYAIYQYPTNGPAFGGGS